ncbi:monoamine oxidase N [Pyrenophora tritici-repentis Pt-1C-BFP]|uniref:Amine oxidase n=2 Tax=Pyrenophora tritici-repentis TaxID=45151 RepID=B2WNH8_PYRTR|nr:monoamine oxidase N [Pyrenophora tritici-repentis Pt-1C-BFP]EDU44588.1 monoamine oxidase N [Pyrenophora tritici-repentis Pt-1C-BFP]
MTSCDGYCWTPKEGLKAGVPSVGVISPSSNISSLDVVYDVVVIGAGYFGLTAARNMAAEGLNMGGTWIHWAQANVWREALRYQMQQDLEKSFDFSKGVNHFELRSTHESITMSHKEEDELVASALEKFTNIDGVYGRKVIPLPCSTFKNPESSSLDLISAQDRIKEIANTLTPQERTVLEASILLASGGTLETTSFHEFMHWWAMCGYTYAGWMERLITWKFRDGQSAFAQRFFEEALATRRLSYAFNTPIKNIHDTGSSVKVTTRKGRTYRALRTISTVPLNVLSSITFDSPLSAGKQAAIALGHVNQTTKVHAEIANPELRSWTSVNYPDNKLNCAIGNGTTPAGNTHIVCFGGQHNHMDLEADIDVTKRAVSSLFNPIQYDADEITIERIVFHDWSQDKFAKGAWFFSPPGLVVKHLGDMCKRHGNILFENSDWALGWRGFVDGAIEEGTRVGYEVRKDLLGESASRFML